MLMMGSEFQYAFVGSNKPPGQSQLEFHMIESLSIMRCEEASPGWGMRLDSAE